VTTSKLSGGLRPPSLYDSQPRKRSTPKGRVSLLAQLFSSERWYRDGKPAWDDMPTAKDTEVRRKKAIDVLNTAPYIGGPALAAVLARCRPHFRCQSPACPACALARQRWAVRQLRRIYRGTGNDCDRVWRFVTFVPPKDPRLDELEPAAVKNLFRQISYHAEKTGLELAFGAIEVGPTSLRHATPYGHVHLFVFGEKDLIARFVSKLKRQHKRNDRWGDRPAYRPTGNREVDGSNYGFSYPFKPLVVEMQHVWTGRSSKLDSDTEAAIRLALHKLGPERALYMFGVRVRKTKAGPRLVVLDLNN
jgi:hypothetical protein